VEIEYVTRVGFATRGTLEHQGNLAVGRGLLGEIIIDDQRIHAVVHEPLTDGQIYLETDLFYQGVRPAISVGLSVSRVGSAAQIKAMKQVAGKIKLDLAQYRELAAFAQFGSDLDAKTQATLERGKRIVELFKQSQYNPIPVEIQVSILWTMQNGLLDDIAVDKVKDFQSKITDFLNTRKPALLEKIRTEKAINDALAAELKAAVNEFKQSYR